MDDFTNTTIIVGLVTGLGLVVISGIWVYRDAKENRIPIDRKPYSTNNGAWAWFGSCILLWIAAFPYYLYKRSKVLNKSVKLSLPTNESIVPQPLVQDFEEQLIKLARLKDSGVLTDEEFIAKKRLILGLRTAPITPVPLSDAPVLHDQPPLSGHIDHSLVWVNAFVPLFGIVINVMLAAMGLTTWLAVPIIIGANVLLLSKDEKQLKALGLQTKDLGAAWLVPVYLFKRVQVAGGGYGYAVCWMITFFISILL